MENRRYFILHYGELALKGRNRDFFERTLLSNIKESFGDQNYDFLRRISGRFILKLNERSDAEKIGALLEKIFGLVYFCPALETSQDLETMKQDVWRLLSEPSQKIFGWPEHLDRPFKSFKIDARRAGKSFPFHAQNVNEIIGEYIKNKSGAKVDLETPELTVHIEIVERWAFVFFKKTAAPGGLPAGVSGRVVSLLSSGLDSPVASFRMMKRGCEPVFVHFHSYPMTSRNSQENVVRIAEILRQYQPDAIKIHFIPFLEIQKKILKDTPEKLRVVLYRRQMLAIAESVARKEGALGLVTGESVGQVASQTLDNILAIDNAAQMPVFRPLAGCDKDEVTKEAKRIGTYEVSIRPYDDCCSLFIPAHPETHARLTDVLQIEKKLKLKTLLNRAIKTDDIKII